ncbi:hypothetical protein HYDPIDRAFT_109149 [Hydnomerulius pinastri MD-312]|nr:hypothetical protein HYDPIDRAFT_109149 [Hydnomerulius pinastri MD-312]
MVSKSLIFATLSFFATSALAGCGFSKQGDGFEFHVYGESDCGNSKGSEFFDGNGDDPFGQCANLDHDMNDKVKSFVFTASDRHKIELFEDAGCKGTSVGSSVGSWVEKEVSYSGQRMSSFKISLHV